MAGRGALQEYGAGQTMGFLEMEGTAAVSALLSDPTPFMFGRRRATTNILMLSVLSLRYWEYLLGLTLSLLVIHTFIRPTAAALYTNIIGYVGLAI